MVCPRCARPLRPLFISVVCDYCDGLAIEEGWDRGWVVWRRRPMPAEEYVFATQEDAERWRTIQGLDDAEILPVCAPSPFRWRKSNGSVKDLTMADRLVTIYPDRRVPPAPNRACLAYA